MKYNSSLFLRLGLAFVFIYAAVSAITNSNAWIGFVPEFVEIIASRETFLMMHHIVNLGLGVWLISGKKTYWAGIAACVALAAITLSNLNSMLIVFRDVGLFMAALALVVLSKKKN